MDLNRKLREEKVAGELRNIVGYKSGAEESEIEFGKSQNPYLVGFSTELLQLDSTTSPGISLLTSSCPS